MHISKQTIPYTETWEKMCLETGNFLQSSYYDTINSIYRNVPYYIYVTDENGTLLGGCKIGLNESRRLPKIIRSISRRAVNYGEYLLSPLCDEQTKKSVANLIHDGITQLLKQEKISLLQVYGHYGNKDYLYTSPKIKNVKHLYIGTINLEQSIEELWDNVHSKHRNVIRKAEKDGVHVVCDNDYKAFKAVLFETFNAQADQSGPWSSFLDNFYTVTMKEKQAYIYNSYYNGIHCGSAFIHVFGPIAEYSFAGSNKTHNGANTLMQWQIIKDMKAAGIKEYCLGEIADTEESYNNERFELGISRFKKRFGCELRATYIADIVLSGTRIKIWQSLLKLRKLVVSGKE